MSRLPILSSGSTGRADLYGRSIRYLRLSIIDRCNFACTYCMPPGGVEPSRPDALLRFDEMVRLVRVTRQIGVRTVRLTGGEPLLRRGVPDLLRSLRDDAGIIDLALTTNGAALAKSASALVGAGLRRLNVSLDSLDPVRFQRLTRGGELPRVLAGIDAALHAGVPELKINVVVVRGENAGELPELVEWAWARGITPRLIELMPLGAGADLGAAAVVPVAELRRALAPLLGPGDSTPEPGRGPATYLPSRTGGHRVGFIGAVTENFCGACNRIRITAGGELRPCLASTSGLCLRALLRQGVGDDELLDRIGATLFGKGEGHRFGQPDSERVEMSQIGG